MNTSDLLAILSHIESKEIYFGPQGFRVISEQDELSQAQVGYSCEEDGSDLTGIEEGQWHANWLVIAMDLEMGDPYFVDVTKAEFPVYTAIQGENYWHVEVVTPSLVGFINSLNCLQKISQQAESLFVPEDTSMRDEKQLKQLQQQLIELSGAEAFWSVFFANYLDWLEDDDEF